MTEWQDVILKRFETFRGDLQDRPGMNDWESGCRRLGDVLLRWIEEYTEAFSETPSRFTSRRADDPTPAFPAAATKNTHRRVELIVDTLTCHWLNEVEDVPDVPRQAEGENRHEGIELGERLREGFGRRKRSLDGETPAAPEFARLGGDPLHDILLVDAIVAAENRAIDYFTKRLWPSVKPILKLHAGRIHGPLEDRWLTFVSDFVAPSHILRGKSIAADRQSAERDTPSSDPAIDEEFSPPRIAGYDGIAGLLKFVSTSLARELSRPLQKDWKLDDHLRHLTFEEQWDALTAVLAAERLDAIHISLRRLARDEQRQHCPPEFRVKQVRNLLTECEISDWRRECNSLRGMHVRGIAKDDRQQSAEFDECDRLLVTLLSSALQQPLSARERLVIQQRFHDHSDNKTIALLLKIDPGNATRTRQQALGKMLNFIDKRINADDAFAKQCKPCWQPVPSDMSRLSDLLFLALDRMQQSPKVVTASSQTSPAGGLL